MALPFIGNFSSPICPPRTAVNTNNHWDNHDLIQPEPSLEFLTKAGCDALVYAKVTKYSETELPRQPDKDSFSVED